MTSPWLRLTLFGASVFVGAAAIFATTRLLDTVSIGRLALVLPPALFLLYLYLVRTTILNAVRRYSANFKDLNRYTDTLQRNWDVLLILALLAFLFLYRLETWNIIRLEEWVVHDFFATGDWLQYRAMDKLNSIFIPTFILASLLPFDTVIEYRYFTAGLSILGGIIYYLAIREAAKSRRVAGIATSILVFHTWIVLFGRMFFVSWSGLLLSSLVLFLFIRFKESSAHANGLLNGLSILNFAHSVFFVFPFFVAERIQRRKTMSLRQIVVPLILFAALIIPSIFLFLDQQPRRLSQEFGQSVADANTITVPGTDTDIYWPVDVVGVFKAFHDSISITAGALPFAYADFSPTSIYTLLTALLLIYPLLAIVLSPWEYRYFFGLGALFSLLVMIVFPMTVNPSYTKEMLIFAAPLIGYGAVKSPHRWFQLLSILLAFSLIGVYAADTFNDIIFYDHEHEFDTRIGERLGNNSFVVGQEAKQLIEDSSLTPLEGYNYTVARCDQIAAMDVPAVTSFPSCAGPNKTMVSQTRQLYLSK